MNTKPTPQTPWPSLSLETEVSRTFSTALDDYQGSDVHINKKMLFPPYGY